LTGTRLSAWGPDMQPDTRVLSLNGLPPGVPWEVPPGLILSPGGNPGGFVPAAPLSLPIDAQFTTFEPQQAFTIVLEADTDGDGQFEPLASMQLENTIQIGDGQLTIVRNANGSVTITWLEGWTLQQSSTLPGSWSNVPGVTSPFTFTPVPG